MKFIKCTREKVAQIDDEDFNLVSKYKWCILFTKSRYKEIYYAKTWNGNKKKLILMHRLILNPKENEFIDHIDGNGLNNIKNNLRICNRSQNAINRGKPGNGRISKYKGIKFNKLRNKKWTAYIQKDGKTYYLGTFKTEKEAALAYNEAAIKYYGEFARLNKIEL